MVIDADTEHLYIPVPGGGRFLSSPPKLVL